MMNSKCKIKDLRFKAHLKLNTSNQTLEINHATLNLKPLTPQHINKSTYHHHIVHSKKLIP